MSIAIRFESVSKQYRLGEVGTRTLSRDLERAWARLRGKPDPFAKVGVANDRESAGGEFVWALHDVTLDVPEGEVLGIIGRNGAGKSTLLKLLSRVTAPTSGRIKAMGRVISLLEVGTGFHPELTGRENVFLNGALLGMSRREIRRRFDEIVDFSGCAKYIDTPVKRYSSGMLVRLGFSVAAHLDCEVLVVDEVLAVGDAEFQRKSVSRMRSESQSGKTVLFVSHNMAAIANLCSRVAVMTQGKLDFVGETRDAIERYIAQNAGNSADLTMSTRSAGKCIAIRSAWLEDLGGKAIDAVRMGAGFRVCFSYELPYTHHGVLFGFGIESAAGTRIFSLNNEMLDSPEPMTTRSGTVSLEIEHPNLSQGQFLISVSLVADGQWLDFVEHALAFEVIEADVYGSGKIPVASQGVVFLRGEIHHKPA